MENLLTMIETMHTRWGRDTGFTDADYVDATMARDAVISFVTAPLNRGDCNGCGEPSALREYIVTDDEGIEFPARYCSACAESAVGDGNMMGGHKAIRRLPPHCPDCVEFVRPGYCDACDELQRD